MATRTASLTEKQREFLRQPYYAAVTTLREDGSPHTTVVWVDVDDEGVVFNTATGRVKPHNLERDPRLSLIVIDPQDGYRWLAVDGRAETTTEGADAHIDRLAKKYLGKDVYPWHKPEERRITVRIRPERVQAHGLD
ncbi:MAG TPA: PPOX class F420-dependent oxidoreductase [Gaiellaceae bacterium]|nr:PPOX class F420-dependent oxidoreductase [Gaiellaceae bacterium]